jgi:hypothetical protein
MMYMADCLEGTWQLMMAPRDRLTRTTYNVQSMSFSPAQLAAAIQVSELGCEQATAGIHPLPCMESCRAEWVADSAMGDWVCVCVCHQDLQQCVGCTD